MLWPQQAACPFSNSDNLSEQVKLEGQRGALSTLQMCEVELHGPLSDPRAMKESSKNVLLSLTVVTQCLVRSKAMLA